MIKKYLLELFWWLPIGSVPEIKATDLQRRLKRPKDKPNLIDVRTVGEWKGGHIAKTLNMPLSLIRSQVGTLPYKKDEPVVVICRSAMRSIPAVRVLEKSGFSNVSQLEGGMMAWEKKKYPVKKG